MMEDCAPGMSTQQGCTDDSDVIETFKEALKQRVGQERFQIWFSGVQFNLDSEQAERSIVAITHGQFAADRLAKHYLSAMRGAAASALGASTAIKIQVQAIPAKQVELPFAGGTELDAPALDSQTPDGQASSANKSSGKPSTSVVSQPRPAKRRTRRSAQSIHAILRDGTDSRKPVGRRVAARPSETPLLDLNQQSAASEHANSGSPRGDTPGREAKGGLPSRGECNWENFVAGRCNELARTACKMAIETPGLASPLVLWGPPGSGKTHLLSAVADKLRRIHRMRRVLSLSAEEFTNDFIKALNGNCLPAFRSRFRDADALLVDDIQFFVEKKATIRELHHTIEMLADYGKPLVFAGTKAPTEINGLGGELSGRLASGLVCQVEALDNETRKSLMSRYASQRCNIAWPEDTLAEIADVVDGDGRLLSGIVNLVVLLQRMHGRMPSLDEIRQHGGHLLRRAGVPITLSGIERAVEKVFQLDAKSLQSESQTKSVTEPRMLAMYLSRELTSSAFSEIGGHFGGRSHSTAILANQRVRQWLDAGRSIGRGKAALSAEEAIRRIESMLKTG